MPESTNTMMITNVEKSTTADVCSSANWLYGTPALSISGVTNIDAQGVVYSTSTLEVVRDAVLAVLGAERIAEFDDRLAAAALLPSSPNMDLGWEVTPPVDFDPALYYVKTQVDTLLAGKEDVGTSYTKSEVNTLVSDFTTAVNDKLPLSGGTLSGALNMGGHALTNVFDPVDGTDAVNKDYVDTALSTVAVTPRLTINLQTDTGSVTTSPKITNALVAIGTTNGYTINLGFGEYREPGPVVFNDKWQLQLVGPQSANTTAVTIKNGVTISNSNGVRFMRVQVEGATSIACRAGLGQQFERSQFMGNTVLSGTGGFMIFTDCEFGANVTIDPAFGGVVYFIRCNLGNASGVYTFSQASALQAIFMDCTGLPNTQIAKASYSGTILQKNNVQKYYINGVAINPAGATNGQVLQYVAGTSTEWVPRTLTTASLAAVETQSTGGAKTLASQATWNAAKAAYREMVLVGVTVDNRVFSATYPIALFNEGRVFAATVGAESVALTVGALTGNTYNLTLSAGVNTFQIYARA